MIKVRTNTARNPLTRKFTKGPHKATDELKKLNPPAPQAPLSPQKSP